MPKLDLHHLKMLEAISLSPTLSEAANRLSVSPSALTHRVREAERRLGARLLLRGRRRPALTEAGERILRVATRCLRDLEVAESEAAGPLQGMTELVRVGASTLSGYEWLPQLLRLLSENHPHIEVEVALDVSLDPVSALKQRVIDIAVMPARIKAAPLCSQRLFRDEMIAILPAAHPKSDRPYLNAADLVDEVYLADGVTPETGREYERLFEPSGVRPVRVLRAGHTAVLVAMVKAGLGVTILTRRAAAAHLAAGGLAAVRLTRRGLYLNWYAVMRNSAAKSAAVRTVAELMTQAARVHHDPLAA